MADRIIVYWRDIPAQVIIKKGRTNAKRELSLRFTEAIDMCAMRTGAAETDDYLAEWRKADPKKAPYSVENTGFNFQEVRMLPNYVSSTPTSCQMKRP